MKPTSQPSDSSADLVPDTTGLVPPEVLVRSGQRAVKLYNSYLHLSIRSDDSRQTYRSALTLFLRYMDTLGVPELLDVEPEHVRAYLDHRTKALGRVASARVHFSAIRALFQHYVDAGFCRVNPAASVKYAFVTARKGKTPVIRADDVRALLDSIPTDPACPDDPAKQTDLRDRALIGLMAYTFCRIGGALSANLGDYRFDDGEMWLDMVEKGAKSHTVPVVGAARRYLDEYIARCGLSDPAAPLFQSANRNGVLNGNRYNRNNSRRMIAARAEALGIGGRTSGQTPRNHTFRATGITHFLESGGRIDDAQDIANHADSATTRRYDRRDNKRLVGVLKGVDY